MQMPLGIRPFLELYFDLIARYMKSSTAKRKEVQLSREQEEEIEKAFRLLDRDCEGIIDTRELKLFFIALGFQLKKEELKQMIFENEERGLIPFEKARALAERKMVQRDPQDMIRQAFKLLDEESRGRIGLRELKKASRELGEVYTEEELFEMIAQVGSAGDGEVSQEDFSRLMKKTKLFGIVS